MIRFKTCFKCNSVKPLTDFYKHSAMADGHLNKCKECAKYDATQHRNNNLEKVRAYDRKRSKNKDRIAIATEYTKLWRKADRRRVVAHNAVARAIKSGKLKRLPCEQCGNDQSVAHHDDYDKPLFVKWLCHSCHIKHHKRLNT
jgi:ribosomal protein S27AE